jgi:uncharacterized protein YdeI (YjbR/CyaY-like superfamily)
MFLFIKVINYYYGKFKKNIFCSGDDIKYYNNNYVIWVHNFKDEILFEFMDKQVKNNMHFYFKMYIKNKYRFMFNIILHFRILNKIIKEKHIFYYGTLGGRE